MVLRKLAIIWTKIKLDIYLKPHKAKTDSKVNLPK